MGLCEYVIVHTIVQSSHFVDRAEWQAKMASIDVMRTDPILSPSLRASCLIEAILKCVVASAHHPMTVQVFQEESKNNLKLGNSNQLLLLFWIMKNLSCGWWRLLFGILTKGLPAITIVRQDKMSHVKNCLVVVLLYTNTVIVRDQLLHHIFI